MLPLFSNVIVAGVTVELTAFANGVKDPVVDETLLGKIENLRYNEIVSPVEYGIEKIKTLLDGRFNTNNKILDGALYVVKTDTLANHKNTVKMLNSQNINYQCNKLVDEADYKGSSIYEFSFINAVFANKSPTNSPSSIISLSIRFNCSKIDELYV